MSFIFNSTLLEKRKSNFYYTIQKSLFIYSEYRDLVITKSRFFLEIHLWFSFRGLSAVVGSLINSLPKKNL